MSNDNEQLTELLKQLDEPQHAILRLNGYYRGDDRALSFVAPEVQSALGERFPKVVVNYIRLAVNSIAERLSFDPPMDLVLSGCRNEESAL